MKKLFLFLAVSLLLIFTAGCLSKREHRLEQLKSKVKLEKTEDLEELALPQFLDDIADHEVKWRSNRPDVVKISESVGAGQKYPVELVRQDKQIEVTLTATITMANGKTEEVKLKITIKAKVAPDPDPDPDPNPNPNPNPNPDEQTLADVIALADEAKFSTKATVTAIIGKNVYVQDATAGFLLYFEQGSMPTDVAVGKEISIAGSKITFYGIPETKDPTVSVVGDGTIPAAIDVTFGEITKNLSKLINMRGLKIVTLPAYKEGSSFNVKVTDGTNEFDLRADKALADVKLIHDALRFIPAGETFDVEGGVASSFSQKGQFGFTKLANLKYKQKELVDVTLTYHYEGLDDETEVIQIREGQNVEIPDKVKAGYTFDETNSGNVLTGVAAQGLVLHRYYTKDAVSYNITVDLQGGTIVPGTQYPPTIRENGVLEKKQFPAPTAPDGKVFKHWSLTVGGAEYDWAQPVTADITFYAVYEDIVYLTLAEVLALADGTQFSHAKAIVTAIVDESVFVQDTTAAYCLFYNSGSAVPTDLVPGKEVVFSGTTGKNYTVPAVKNPTYEIIGDATIPAAVDKTFDELAANLSLLVNVRNLTIVKLPAYEEGRSFNVNVSDGTKEFNLRADKALSDIKAIHDKLATIEAGTTFDIEAGIVTDFNGNAQVLLTGLANIVYTPPVKVTVTYTYHYEGLADETETITVNQGDAVTIPDKPKAGFTFDEANSANVLTGTAADGLVLHRYYSKDTVSYTITVDLQGGTAAPGATYPTTIGENATLQEDQFPAPVAPAEQVFSHWSLAANGADYDWTRPVTEDITLYAVYADIQYLTMQEVKDLGDAVSYDNAKATITAIMDKNVYVQDATNSYLLYFKTVTVPSDFAVGKEVAFSGTNKLYENALQAEDPTNLRVLGDGMMPTAIDVTYDQIATNRHKLINMRNLELVSVPATFTAGKWFSVKVTDGTNEFDVFVDKSLTDAQEVYNKFKEIEADPAPFALEGGIADVFRGNEQFRLTGLANIKYTAPVKVTITLTWHYEDLPDETETVTVNEGSAVEIADRAKAGYVFDESNASNVLSGQAATGLVLHRYYKKDTTTYTITIDLQGGTAPAGASYPTSVLANGTLVETDYPAPTLTDKEFVCWSSEAGGEAYDWTQPVTANLTLYAVWRDPVVKTLFFSEYIEGSGAGNKALEIYNPTGAAVDLSEYTVELYSNGASTASKTATLSGTLADGDVYVISNTGADQAVLNVADMTDNGICNFNGDDAVVLKHNGTIIDVIGQVGVRKNWSDGGVTTKDQTLVRKPGTLCGHTDNVDYNTVIATLWDAYPKDTFTYIGSHTN